MVRGAVVGVPGTGSAIYPGTHSPTVNQSPLGNSIIRHRCLLRRPRAVYAICRWASSCIAKTAADQRRADDGPPPGRRSLVGPPLGRCCLPLFPPEASQPVWGFDIPHHTHSTGIISVLRPSRWPNTLNEILVHISWHNAKYDASKSLINDHNWLIYTLWKNNVFFCDANVNLTSPHKHRKWVKQK